MIATKVLFKVNILSISYEALYVFFKAVEYNWESYWSERFKLFS